MHAPFDQQALFTLPRRPLSRARRCWVAFVSAIVLGAVGVAPAEAQFPGVDGRIAFVRQTSGATGHQQIFTMNADGSAQVNISSSRTDDRYPSWSADGRRIVFQRCCKKQHTQIWIMSADGSGKSNLSQSATDDIAPAFSPDGLRIAFTRNGALWVMNQDGSGKSRLTIPPNGGQDAAPSWSPNGTTIVFQRYDPATGAIRVLKLTIATGTTTDLGVGFAPDSSPDGATIVFIADSAGQDHVWTMRGDGGSRTLVNATEFALNASYSPTGTRILYDNGKGGTISTMTAAGTGVTHITGGFDSAWGRAPN